MKHLVVIGGGISGLAAAEGAVAAAGRVGEGLEVSVLEREAEVGGKAVSLAADGYLVEGGPGGFLDNEPALDRLIERTGLTKLAADPSAARRFLVRGGRMREVRASPLAFMGSGLLGPWGLLRILAEPLVSRGDPTADESVWDFAARRLGAQAADRLIAPMVLGVFAGDAKRLSLRAAFPKLHALERDHGSLVRGMIARRRRGTGGGPAGPAGALTSFAGGLQSLPRALAASGRFRVECSRAVVSVAPVPVAGWRVVLADGGHVDADAVVLAGEPWAMAALLPPAATVLARQLDAIVCPPVAVVALGFGPASLARAPRGFGVLIPRGEGYRILGCLWDTHCFPGRSPESRLLLRAMLGGAVDPEIGSLDDEALVDTVRRDLRRLMGLDAAPEFQRVVRWPRAIPQYDLGHLDRVATVRRELERQPGLFIAGNALHGIAFGRAAAAGLAAGEAAVGYLSARSLPVNA